MITIKQIKKAQTISDLENLGIGSLKYDISYRGGHLGFSNSDVASAIGISYADLPNYFGAYCNYLGGGIRGAICTSDFNGNISGRKRQLLVEIAEACKRVYENIENEAGLNDDYNDDGDTNWNAKATNAVRNAGITSAY